MTNTEFLRRRLLEKAGLAPAGPSVASELFEEYLRTEWSPLFERRMREKLWQGAFRYGRIGAPGKPQYDRVAEIKRRLAAYVLEGNTEFLVDAANLCLLEFEEGKHPLKHFAHQSRISGTLTKA
jgi:hypothetical protein